MSLSRRYEFRIGERRLKKEFRLLLVTDCVEGISDGVVEAADLMTIIGERIWKKLMPSLILC